MKGRRKCAASNHPQYLLYFPDHIRGGMPHEAEALRLVSLGIATYMRGGSAIGRVAKACNQKADTFEEGKGREKCRVHSMGALELNMHIAVVEYG